MMVACFGLNDGYQLPRFPGDRTIEANRRLDIWQLQRCGALTPGTETEVKWGDGGSRLAARGVDLLVEGNPVAIVWDEPMVGVGRCWFECPACKQRCRHLYLRDPIACRRCHRLDYSSRHRYRSIPGYNRLLYLRRKLGADLRPFTPVPLRRKTARYWRIVAKIRALEARLVGHLRTDVNDVLDRRAKRRGE